MCLIRYVINYKLRSKLTRDVMFIAPLRSLTSAFLGLDILVFEISIVHYQYNTIFKHNSYIILHKD